mgnify:CR=1 FL=1
MKRKRFEKLLISQHKSQARDIRQAVRSLIELRHYSEEKKGVVVVYDKESDCFTELEMRPYSEMYDRIVKGKRAIGD